MVGAVVGVEVGVAVGLEDGDGENGALPLDGWDPADDDGDPSARGSAAGLDAGAHARQTRTQPSATVRVIVDKTVRLPIGCWFVEPIQTALPGLISGGRRLRCAFRNCSGTRASRWSRSSPRRPSPKLS